MKFLRDVLNLVLSKFYGFVNLRVIFNNICRIKSFFPYKDRISRSQRSKVVQCIGLIVGTAILSTSVKRNDDYIIGRLNILRLSAISTGHNIKWDHLISSLRESPT